MMKRDINKKAFSAGRPGAACGVPAGEGAVGVRGQWHRSPLSKSPGADRCCVPCPTPPPIQRPAEGTAPASQCPLVSPISRPRALTSCFSSPCPPVSPGARCPRTTDPPPQGPHLLPPTLGPHLLPPTPRPVSPGSLAPHTQGRGRGQQPAPPTGLSPCACPPWPVIREISLSHIPP